MALGSGSAAVHLAQRLRELREHEWDDRTVRQAHLATALDASPATVSSYESVSAPKAPTTARLTAYAQFFATRRSVDGDSPTLHDLTSFTPDERERFVQLKAELFALHAAIGRDPARARPGPRSTAGSSRRSR
ncbi:helix-turn-helix domain-containing protein [Pseudonocardia charpentierae]|uniref:Helix-turn-helix transcriptional regulator n=1 Tax=Pseudonocardia charpentierae TaxID=3075545 RepID=A0ABU2N6H3_9PSEU|nr:helix-turn-helix transcriptional regulator [Pseudonocardia sp. DSM 45834]MDT0349533.1 helix-turn-helix transcriptional regulator [Pseudonocardia sp. DSM 45834]